jgi:DNA anti-recombination protein RmuC
MAVANGTTSDRDGNGRLQGQVNASLEQVREILFGAPFRDLERKLLRVDSHLASEAEELRKEMRRRLGVLETHVQRESEALAARFEAERTAHAEALAAANRDARDSVVALEQRVTRMEEALARAQRELRQQILDQAKSFLDETRQARDEMSAKWEREIAAITDPTDAEESSSERYVRAEARAQTSDH